MTPLQAEYKREYALLKERAKRLSEAQIEYTLPKYPKKITRKGLDRIKNLRGDALFSIATKAIDIETGEVVKGKGIKNVYKSNRETIKKNTEKQLSNEIENFLDNWIEQLEGINSRRKKGDYDGYHLLKSWFYSGMRVYGRKEFGRRMLEAEQQGNLFSWETIAYLQIALEYVHRVNALLPDTIDYDGEEMTKEEWMERFEDYTANIFEDY